MCILFPHVYTYTREGGSLQIITLINRDWCCFLSSTINQFLSYSFFFKIASRNSLALLFYSWILGSYRVIPNYLNGKKTNMDSTSLFAFSNASITPQWYTSPSIVNALMDNTDSHCLIQAWTPLTIKTNHYTSVGIYWKVKIQEMEISPWIKFLTGINPVSIRLICWYMYQYGQKL